MPERRAVEVPADVNAGELRAWRAAHGLSLADLAGLLGVPRATLHRWERGSLAIRHPTILRLALAELDRRLGCA